MKERETTTKMVDYVHARKRKKIDIAADVNIHDVFLLYKNLLLYCVASYLRKN